MNLRVDSFILNLINCEKLNLNYFLENINKEDEKIRAKAKKLAIKWLLDDCQSV
jgi:hypothetical protein